MVGTCLATGLKGIRTKGLETNSHRSVLSVPPISKVEQISYEVFIPTDLMFLDTLSMCGPLLNSSCA